MTVRKYQVLTSYKSQVICQRTPFRHIQKSWMREQRRECLTSFVKHSTLIDNTKLNAKLCLTISIVESKKNKSCKNYFEIETPDKYVRYQCIVHGHEDVQFQLLESGSYMYSEWKVLHIIAPTFFLVQHKHCGNKLHKSQDSGTESVSFDSLV